MEPQGVDKVRICQRSGIQIIKEWKKVSVGYVGICWNTSL
jgi:hypothetical protein